MRRTIPTLPRPGERVDHYELIRAIDDRSPSSLFLARDLRLGRRVAIRIWPVVRPEITERLVQEANAIARCQHESIATVHDVGICAGAPYVAHEYLRGTPLDRLVTSGRSLPYPRAVEIACSVVRAVACAHAQGLVHRDLKPSNVFVLDTGLVKIVDFAVSSGENGGRTGESPRELTASSIFRSPEQWCGDPVDALTDIWACGMLLYWMICGRPLHPIDGSALGTAILDREMPSLAANAPAVPAELVQVVDRCVRRARHERWQTARELHAALEPFVPGRRAFEVAVGESPYAGLCAFENGDAGRFFGRDREIAAILTKIRQHPLVVVVGSSGAGKSSFLRAGVISALAASGEPWDAVVIRPGYAPFDTLATILAPERKGRAAQRHRELVDVLRSEPGRVGNLLRSRAQSAGHRALLVVDAFEELYTLVQDPDERAAFLACLAAIADDANSPLRVVIAVRNDFLDRLAEDTVQFPDLASGLFFLGPPDRAGLREAIIRPAALAGFGFELPAIVDDMLDHLETTHGALPLLQFTADRLWSTRDTSRKLLTHESYASMGGVTGALARHADQVVAELGAADARLVRALLLRLVTPERTRAILRISDLHELARDPAEIDHMLARLVEARLLVTRKNDAAAAETVELVHESLVHNWPTLRRWLDEIQDDAVLVERIRVASRQWDSGGRRARNLWRGQAAEEVLQLERRYQGPLSQRDRAFLGAVIAQREAERFRREGLILGGFALVLLALVITFARLRLTDGERHELEESAMSSEAARRDAELELEETQRQLRDKRPPNSDLGTDTRDKLLELTEGIAAARRGEERAAAAAEAAQRIAHRAQQAAADALAAKAELQRAFEAERARALELEQRFEPRDGGETKP